MLKQYIILILILCNQTVFGQDKTEMISGTVSYLTSNNVYVKFISTEMIKVGDTLLLSGGQMMTACLVVTQKSSTSCVCQKIGQCDIQKNDALYFKNVIEDETPRIQDIAEEVDEGQELVFDRDTLIAESQVKKDPESSIQNIRARVSAASYSSLRADDDSKHRLMYRFSLNADNINDSKFSLESYLNFRQNIESGIDNSERQNNFFRVYNLAINYAADSSLNLTIGRKINYKASSLGAIDGLQAEKFFGNYYVGAIVGFRPDIFEYDFNPDLLEYGAYAGVASAKRNLYSQTTFGLLEQKNAGKVDRRYTYFQHSSTIGRKLNLFASFELDLYNKVDGVQQSPARLTNLFVSSRYRISRKIDFSVSYDARKRIIYYETLKTEVERLLDDDETRQGIRGRINIRPIKYVTTGLSFARRFQSDQQNQSDNINGYLSISKVPGILGSLSVNYNMNNSSYLESKIISVRHSRSMFRNKINLDLYFRNVNYQYLNSETQIHQQYGGMNVNFRIARLLSFSSLVEITFRETKKDYRINTKLIKRFGK